MTQETVSQAPAIKPAKLVASGFLRKNKARDSAKRKLARHFMASVDVIASIMEDPKEKADVRVKAASLIAGKYLDVLKEESNDEIRRLEAQLRLNNSLEDAGEFSTDDEDVDLPLVDFDNIQAV